MYINVDACVSVMNRPGQILNFTKPNISFK